MTLGARSSGWDSWLEAEEQEEGVLGCYSSQHHSAHCFLSAAAGQLT